MSIASYLPWTDRAGRLSTLKLAFFAVALFPALTTLWAAFTVDLGPRPLTAALLQTGDHAVWLLLGSLAVTPLRRIGEWPRLILVRRMLGLAALFYTGVHLLLFAADKMFDLGVVFWEIVLRFYLTIGFVALLGLLALGLTSNDAALKRLGGQNWNRLHSLVYSIGLLVLLHFFLQSKADVSKSLWALGLFALLMGVRGLHRWKLPLTAPFLAGLGLACVLGTAGLEAFYYATKSGVDWRLVLAGNLDPDIFPRPAHYVALGGFALVVIRLLRPQMAKPARARKDAGPQRASSLTPSEASASQ